MPPAMAPGGDGELDHQQPDAGLASAEERDLWSGGGSSRGVSRQAVVIPDAARYLSRMMMIYSTIASRYRA